MAYIETIHERDATGELADLYRRSGNPDGTVDNVMKAHSLRPHTMEGHLALYRSVLHNPDNTLPLWFLETIASWTSALNRCDYSYAHHFSNVRRLLRDDARSERIDTALRADRPEETTARSTRKRAR